MKSIDSHIGADRPPGRRRRRGGRPVSVVGALAAVLALVAACSTADGSNDAADTQEPPSPAETVSAAPATAAGMSDLAEQGQEIFRHDTFGDEAFWGDVLQINKAIAGEANGGVGPGVSPKTALAVGLKVDAEALPAEVVDAVKAGKVDLEDPKTTLTLLELDAVVGVKGFFDENKSLRSVGITCAVCHSVVDDSFAPGIGVRQDGWANRDLNVGAIINLAPPGRLKPVADMLHTDEATVRKVLNSWGPGRFDAELFLDGKAFRPDGKTASTLIPPAFGLSGVNLHTYSGWGSVTQWNAFVAVLEMHGQGTYLDSRLDDKKRFPIAAENKLGHTRPEKDLVTSKLPALAAYEQVLLAPVPEPGSFDAEAAKRGEAVFSGKATCATCHVPPLFTEPGFNLHKPKDIGIDAFQAERSPTGMYRTTPLKGLWTHQKGGFYHDGRFPTLADVVQHYDKFFKLGLSDQEKKDLAEYMKSL